MQSIYRVSIFRDASGIDCTNNGVSSKFTDALLYRSAADIPLDRPTDLAILILDTAPVHFNKPIKRIRAIPVDEKRWLMFGGNFIWSSDSRFREEVSEFPIPVHDRIEG